MVKFLISLLINSIIFCAKASI